MHYGFVLKELDKNLEHAVVFLKEGIESRENGTQEGLFYMNLGDTLIRLGRREEALDVRNILKLYVFYSIDFKYHSL